MKFTIVLHTELLLTRTRLWTSFRKCTNAPNAWGKKTNKMQQYRWFIVNSGCWLLTLSQHVSGIFMPIFRRKTTSYCMWSVFAGSAGCGRLRYCGATLRVWSLWRLLFEQQPSQWSHPQRSTIVPQPAAFNTTSKYTPHAVTRGLSPEDGHRCPKYVETVSIINIHYWQ